MALVMTMMKRTGNDLIISGIILLLLKNQSVSWVMSLLLKQLMDYWPILLIVIGYMMQSRKKKRKTR